jgi:transposase
MAKNRRKFSPEFKEEAVKLVIEESRAVADSARAVGVNEQTLRNWVAAYPPGACG